MPKLGGLIGDPLSPIDAFLAQERFSISVRVLYGCCSKCSWYIRKQYPLDVEREKEKVREEFNKHSRDCDGTLIFEEQ